MWQNKASGKGILHGESDTAAPHTLNRKETIELNNEIFGLENEERREVHRILQQLTRPAGDVRPLAENSGIRYWVNSILYCAKSGKNWLMI